ncbi:putative xylanase 3 [Astrocystis sublimbata]|nr:putative xylanase 3 [Astrocystis sublimbata]
MAGRSLPTLLFVVFQAIGRASGLQEVNDDQCNCYVTNDTSTQYYTSHTFFDFRSLNQFARVPAPIEDPYDSTNADETSRYFLDDNWTKVWGIQQWNNSDSKDNGDVPVLMVNSPNNIYIEKNNDENPASDTFMTMRTIRHKHFQSASEFESISKAYHFLSVRMYARTLGPPGAVTAMFTYRDDSGDGDIAKVQESDLEIRTQDPVDKVQYTNQPSYSTKGEGFDIPESTRNITTPVRADWTQWAVHRMDWTPKDTTWFIDDKEVASIAFQVPRDPSQVIFNCWSDGGEWSGNMTVGDDAYLQIQWIEMVYNSTGDAKTNKRSDGSSSLLFNVKREEEGCKNVCSIDESTTLGKPVLVQDDSAASTIVGLGVAYFWIPLLLAPFLI